MTEISAVFAKHMVAIDALPDDLAAEANDIIETRKIELKEGEDQ